MSSKQDELRNLLALQRKDVPDIGLYGKLSFEDLKRIDRCSLGDITKSKDCCLFVGNTVSNTYCTFSFRGKKTSIIRMLYHNFKGDINSDAHIKYTCENKGNCCNLSHFELNMKKAPKKEEISDNERDSHANEKDDENIFEFDES